MALSEKQERAAARRRAFLLKEGTICPGLPAQAQGAQGDEARPAAVRWLPISPRVCECIRVRVGVRVCAP